MNDIQAMLMALAEIGKELHLVAKHLRTGGEREGASDAFLIGPGEVAQAVGVNPRRTKWWIKCTDPTNDVDWLYRPDTAFGRGAKIDHAGGSYVDDALRCFKGAIYVRCDPTLAPGTQVEFRAGEEYEI